MNNTEKTKDSMTADELDKLLDDFLASCKEDSTADAETAEPTPSPCDETDETDAAGSMDTRQEPTALGELMAMTGLEQVKQTILTQLSYGRIMQARKYSSHRVPPRLFHMVLTGNPGTGKTTVARLIGRIFHEAGLLYSGHTVEMNRASLVGRHIGESEDITSQAIKDARGGILFIDEMYSLCEQTGDGDQRDFGFKVIDTLMPVLSDPESETLVIGAGYRNEMNRMLSINPGLKSRFPIVLDFKDFTAAEIKSMTENRLAGYDISLHPEADEALESLIGRAMMVRDFGNGRFVTNLVDNFILPAMCRRVSASIRDDHSASDICDMTDTILACDIPSLAAIFPFTELTTRRSAGFIN